MANQMQKQLDRQMRRGICLMVGALFLASSAAADVGREQNVRVVDALYREVSERLLAYKQVFGDTELLLTFGTLGDEPELQVQFSPDFEDRCAVWLRYVPRLEESVYQRLFAVVKSEPTISAEQAAARFQLVEETREISCDSPLGLLVRRANELTLPMVSPVSKRTVFIHALTYRMELRSPDLLLSAEFPSALDLPVVTWANAVRHEVLRMLESSPGER